MNSWNESLTPRGSPKASSTSADSDGSTESQTIDYLAMFEDVLDERGYEGGRRLAMMELEDYKKVVLVKRHLNRGHSDSTSSGSKFVRRKDKQVKPQLHSQSINVDLLDGPQFDALFNRMLDELNLKTSEKEQFIRYPMQYKVDLLKNYQFEPKMQNQASSSHHVTNVIQASNRTNLDSPQTPPKQPSLNHAKQSAGRQRVIIQSYQSQQHGTPSEQSPEWFIVQLANNNLHLKALSRFINLLKNGLQRAGKTFAIKFIQSHVSNIAPVPINGIQSLEIALSRVFEIIRPDLYVKLTSIQPLVKSPSSQLKSASSMPIYADSVVEDELKLDVIKCLQFALRFDAGMAAFVRCKTFPRLIAWCCLDLSESTKSQMSKNARICRAYIALRTTVFEVLGPLCLLSASIRNSITHAFLEMSQSQKQSPLYAIVAGLQNPFYFENVVSSAERPGPQLSDLVDDSEIWSFRLQCMIFINSIVSSSDDPDKRWDSRRLFESLRIRSVLQVNAFFHSTIFSSCLSSNFQDSLK